MRILELALAGVLVLSVPIAAHANERGLEYEANNAGAGAEYRDVLRWRRI